MVQTYNYVIDTTPPSAYGYVRHLGQLCNALGLELRSTASGITQLPLASSISIVPREGVHLSPIMSKFSGSFPGGRSGRSSRRWSWPSRWTTRSSRTTGRACWPWPRSRAPPSSRSTSSASPTSSAAPSSSTASSSSRAGAERTSATPGLKVSLLYEWYFIFYP